MAIHSSILAWEIPWTEEPGRLQSMGSQRVGHNIVTKQRIRSSRDKQKYHRTTLISHASKVMQKPSKLGFNSTWTENFQTFKLDLEKAEEPEIKLPTFTGSSKSKITPEKHLFLLYWLCQSRSLCGSQQTMENSSRDGNTRPPDLLLEKPVWRSGSNS